MTNTGAAVPVTFSPYDYEFHEDPYPIYARLRDEAPLYRNAERGFWALSRHEDVLAAFRDKERLSNANGVTLDPAAYGPHAHKTMSFLAMDDPRHHRMRSLVSKGFTPRRVQRLEPRIEQLAELHLGPAVERGEFDFIGDFAGKLPMDVICELLGVPEADRDALRGLADTVMHREEGVPDVPEPAVAAALELVQYYVDMLAERRRCPTDDLTSALLAAEIDGDRLTDEEIVGFLVLMVVAGNETTTKLLGNAVYWAWRNPEQLAKPMADPQRVPDWVEETLRYDTSTHVLARTATEDLHFHGRTVPSGDCVLLLVGSANRDGRAFADPDRYDLDRDTGRQLVSFGSGTHFCLGAHLARLEARIALTQLVHRVRDYDIDAEAAQRVHSSNVRGFATLPVTVRPRRLRKG